MMNDLYYGFEVEMCMVFVFLIAPSCTAGCVVILQFSFPFEHCITHACLSKWIIRTKYLKDHMVYIHRYILNPKFSVSASTQ